MTDQHGRQKLFTDHKFWLMPRHFFRDFFENADWLFVLFHSFCTSRYTLWLICEHPFKGATQSSYSLMPTFCWCCCSCKSGFHSWSKSSQSNPIKQPKSSVNPWVGAFFFFFLLWLETLVVFPILSHFCARYNTTLNKPELNQMILPS